MRRPVIAGNWKLFKKKEEAVALVSECQKLSRTDTAGRASTRYMASRARWTVHRPFSILYIHIDTQDK